MRWSGELRIRFGGLGGQGAVLLGDVLGLAATCGGLHAAGSTVYGSQARGGASRSDLIISEGEIIYPHIGEPQILAAMAQESYDNFARSVARSGLILYDDYFVKPRENLHHPVESIAVPATRMALDRLKSPQPANFIMLGALSEYTAAVAREYLEKALVMRVRTRYQEQNLAALALGVEFGRNLAKRASQGNDNPKGID